MDASEAHCISVKYEDAKAQLARVLADKGVAIVTGVLTSEEIKEFEAVLMQDMSELVDSATLESSDATVQEAWEKVRREGLHSWPAASLVDVGARGRFQDHGMPHGRFAWRARTHPRVRCVYEILHGTTDLVSSCDNAFVANATQAEVTTNKYWPHVDQNDHETRINCREWNVYQGLLYVWSSQANHASTTVVWPESQKGPYELYMADAKVRGRIAAGSPHFTLISVLEPGEARDSLIQGWEAGARRMPVPAGGLLLWTSRTTHQGWSGGPRLAQPVCWEPRIRRTELMRERKLRLAALGLPSTHWASLGMPHELSELTRPRDVAAEGADEHEAVRLPLRWSVRSQALTPEADMDQLWRVLQSPSWFEPLPAELKATLEASIKEEYKNYL